MKLNKTCSPEQLQEESLPNRKLSFSLAKVLRLIGIKKNKNKEDSDKKKAEIQSDLKFELIKEISYKNYSFLYNPAFDQKPEEANLSESFIRGGMNHPNFQIRSFIATNKNTPPLYLEELAEDENWVVRKSVAANPNTSEKLLKKLAKDSSPHVKLALLDREDISNFLRLELLEDLAKSNDRYIKNRAAIHKNEYTLNLYFDRGV